MIWKSANHPVAEAYYMYSTPKELDCGNMARLVRRTPPTHQRIQVSQPSRQLHL